MIPVPKGQWAKISTNTLADVLLKVGGKYLTVSKGGGDPVTGQFAWSGGSFDTDRGRVVMDANGGHGDGADNGVYDFDAGSGLFSMVKAPTVALIPSTSQPSLPFYGFGGALFKASRHNYGGQVYMPSVKRSWQGSGVAWWSGGGAGPQSWETDPVTGISLPSDQFGIGSGLTGDNTSPDIQSAWDGNHKRVLYCDHGRLRAYDPAKPAGSRVSGVDAAEGDGLSDGRHRDMSALYDPKRDRFVMFGSFAEGTTCVLWEPAGSLYRRRVQVLTPAAFRAQYGLGRAPLVAYDAVSDRYAVTGGGRAIALVNPDTWVVTVLTPGGPDPGAAHSTGTYNRGGIHAGQDVLVVVHSVTGGAWAYRPDRGTVVIPPVVVDPPPPDPDPVPVPVPTSLADLPTRVLVAIEGPPKGKGIWLANGMKHVTMALHPPSGRLYAIGGDYTSFGDPASQSYVQEGWSFDLRERFASSDPSAGWRLAWTYCAAAGEVRPKHPDYVGWCWDAKRGVFWMVPGTMVRRGSEVCAGETTSGPDAAYPFNHLMIFSPTTGVWLDAGGNIGADAEDSWMSTLDPVRDRIVRFGVNGAHGGTYCVLDLTSMAWTYGGLGDNALGGTIRVFKDYHAPDIAGRRIYAMDGISGRLHAFHLDTLTMADLGPIPGGAVMAPDDSGFLRPTSNQTYPVWDSAAKRLIYLRDSTIHVYDPVAATWEAIPAVTSPAGLPVGYRTAVYDAGNNVTVWMGGNEVPNKNLLLFRYAAGTGPIDPPPPPPPPPPVVTPDAELTLGAGVKYRVKGGVLVP